ncbi:MAG: F0F1 ATP synthase subunit B [Anaerolineales bacterium]|nr:MAG: F0F1 ATP synthase subunit B [Anaerolineales bacterium]
MEALGALGVNGPFLLSQIINFLILFLALRFLLWKPMLKMLNERKQRIAQGLEDAEQARKDRERAQAEYGERIKQAEQEREEILARAAEEAEQARAETLAQARAQAEQIVAEGKETVEQERQQMLAELHSQVAALSIAAANKLIGEALDEQRQRRLIDEFFSGIKAGRVVVLEEQEIEQAKAGEVMAIVTSALPLTEDEQKVVTSGLAEHLGRVPAIEFRIDPAILGGLVIRLGDKVIDGSVAGQLASLQERLG